MMMLFVVLLLLAGSLARQTFSREPTDVVVRLGDTVILPCRVEGRTGALQWTRDQFGLGQTRQLPGFPRMKMVGIDPVRDWDLEISAAQIDDEGQYQCQVLASPSSLAIRSRSARLVVVIPSGPPHIHGPAVLSLPAGQEAEVKCSARGGRPAVQLDWEVGQLTVTDVKTWVEKIPGSVTFLTTSMLHLVLDKEDAGVEVVCVATSRGLEDEVARRKIRVTYPPQVSVSLAGSSNVVEEGSVTVQCAATAQPEEVVIAWSLDGRLLEGETSQILVLHSVTRDQQGSRVSCSATNSMGTGQADLTLSVLYGPSLVVSPSSVARTLGSRVTLTCRAEGNPPPSYTWGASHTPGVLGSQPKMTLDISPATVGSYFCTARGAQGREVVSAPAVVALVGVPSITETGVEEGGDESALHCSVRGQKVTVSWRREGEEIVPGGRYMVVTEVRGEEVQSWLTVKEPEEVDFGEYYCVVRWQGGELEKRLVLLPGGQAELVVLQVLLSSLGLLTCLLCLAAAVKLGASLRWGLARGLTARQGQEEEEKSVIYEELDIKVTGSEEASKAHMLRREGDGEEEQEERQGPVLYSINRDYAAYYGNPHLSCNLLGAEEQ